MGRRVTTEPPSHDERRGRWGTKRQVAVAVAGLLLLFFGVDAVARVAMESEVAGRLHELAQLTQRPDVKIRGLLFLPQLIRGAFKELDVTAPDVKSGELHLQQVNAQLLDVRVPFHDVLVRDVHVVGIGHSVVQARIPYPDINAYLKATDRPLTLATGSGGEVEVTGNVVVAGLPLTANGQVSLSVEEGAVRAVPRQIDTGSSTLDQATRALLGDRLSFTLPLETLPFGQQLTAANPYDGGIQVEAQGTGVVLQEP